MAAMRIDEPKILLPHSGLLVGERVLLEGLSLKHLSDRYVSWLNNPEVSRDNSHAVFPTSRAEVEAYIRSVKDSRTSVVFAILWKERGEHVGNVSLQGISWVNRSAEIAILIGEKACWGQGIGTEACRLVLDDAFSRLDLHRVKMGMTTRNTAMIRIAERLGMRQEGVFKDALFKEGAYLDVCQWAIINPRHLQQKRG